MVLKSTKLFLEKVWKLKKLKTKNYENIYNLWRILGTKLLLLVDFWDQIFKTVFPKFFVWFSTLYSKMSRNMRKMRHKVRNGQNLPHESPNFTNYFFSKWLYVQFKPFFHKSETRLPKQFLLNNFFLFFTLNSRMSNNMCIWRHKLCNSKTDVGPTFTLSNEPWYIVIVNRVTSTVWH